MANRCLNVTNNATHQTNIEAIWQTQPWSYGMSLSWTSSGTTVDWVTRFRTCGNDATNLKHTIILQSILSFVAQLPQVFKEPRLDWRIDSGFHKVVGIIADGCI